MTTGKAHRIYLRKDFEAALQKQADQLGIKVDDLIKLRIERSDLEIVQADIKLDIKELSERTRQLELTLSNLNRLIKNLVDSTGR